MKRFLLLFVCMPVMVFSEIKQDNSPEYQLTDLQYLDPRLREEVIILLSQQAERRDRSRDISITSQRRAQENEVKKPGDTQALVQATVSILSKVATTVLAENSACLQDVLAGAITSMVKRNTQDDEEQKSKPVPQKQAPKKTSQQTTQNKKPATKK